MGLWDWAVSTYARAGVAPACLALQDEHGQSVSYLLWAAWAQVADPRSLVRAADIARRWEAQALAPLRDLRRALKPGFPGVPDSAREALREDVKAAELRAERVLLDGLEALGGRASGGDTLEALERASAAWGIPAPANALAALAAALG